jgi:hypothetical protein
MTQRRKLQIALGLFGLSGLVIGWWLWPSGSSKDRDAEAGQQRILEQMGTAADPAAETASKPAVPPDPQAPRAGQPRSAKPSK